MKTYKIMFWIGTTFEAEGTCVENALENLAAKLVTEGEGERCYWLTVEYLEKLFTKEEIRDMDFWYIDATMAGAPFPVYLDMKNAKIEVVK